MRKFDNIATQLRLKDNLIDQFERNGSEQTAAVEILKQDLNYLAQ